MATTQKAQRRFFMKKDVILEALKNAGVELEEDKLKEFITAINIANDSDSSQKNKGGFSKKYSPFK